MTRMDSGNESQLKDVKLEILDKFVQASFLPLELPNERELLATWLSSERWSFHSNPEPKPERILEIADEGGFVGLNDSSFWVMLGTERVGLIHLFDLEDIGDGSPLFDLRIRNEFRGFGIGTQAVTWLTNHLFQEHTNLERIEGTTRVDNIAMRRVFRRCGYAKEAHFRQAWHDVNGQRFDTVGYGILREDWATRTMTPVLWQDET
jgi:RimJ/RimL family protein N-acetyltransferase